MSPKIAAATVKEHHDNMFEKLVDAAEEVLRNHGVEHLTAGAVAQRAGIARNSIYRYVESVDDLREHVIVRYIPRWKKAVCEALADVEDPRDQLLTFLAVALDLAQETGHRWLMGVMEYKSAKMSRQKAAGKASSKREAGRQHRAAHSKAPLGEHDYGLELIRDFHAMLANSVAEPVGRIDGVDPAIVVPLLTALLRAGMGELDEGSELAGVKAAVLAGAKAIVQPA
ncbi:TetR/AcrR family transcriptional regulator [Arcanobacterium canis]|uniref:TetR/AcrR family transcriptional regulator n=1 Tax=Arcanobacterium canis TaxID=999183 RepID=A0ABY8G1H7_9ACTO|nr:TetR/AcrR family transcriptional regulator [Arcanobacterium canis]WFM83341.1 TetR/AcrR family transcriptional regulator [Arcanobacterium canis]